MTDKRRPVLQKARLRRLAGVVLLGVALASGTLPSPALAEVAESSLDARSGAAEVPVTEPAALPADPSEPAAVGVEKKDDQGAKKSRKAKKESKRQRLKRVAEAKAALPERYSEWLDEVSVLISDDEMDAFLELTQDYHRDAFIDRFWKERDPYPDTGRNEFKSRWERRLAAARQEFPEPNDERRRIFLTNGEPAGIREVECSTLLWPMEIWYYSGSDRVNFDFLLVFYKRFGGGAWRIWNPFEGLGVLLQESPAITGRNPLAEIYDRCFEGDKVAGALSYLLNLGPNGFASMLADIDTKPEPPSGEWIATFNAYSTDVPEGAETLDGELRVAYPGRRQSRTVLQGFVGVATGSAAPAELGDYRSYNFILNGEILADEALFDSFRYKFDYPESEVRGDKIPLVFSRLLRPGDYRLVLKVEDLNGKRFLRFERELSVPKLAASAPPPPPDPETARLLAEANAAIGTGDVTLKLIEPGGQFQTGLRRIDTLVTGAGIDRVTFGLDGRPVLTKTEPPYNVELDLGTIPRTRKLDAVAYDAAGNELASDQILINASAHRFAVRIIEPRPGARYVGSLRVRVDVSLPEDKSLERVEIFLNETRVATLYQPPWEQPVILPENDPLAYVQAVAYLVDGNSTQDLAFVNAPDVQDRINIELVELYTTVLDRDGRPVRGLTQDDFSVSEDGTPQEIRRFELVEDRPIHATVLLDVSASMEGRLEETRQAALGFFQQILRPKDRAALVTFNDRPNLVTKLTNDVNALAGGLAGLKAERGTSLYDSLVFGLYYFNGIKGQRAMLVLSDGKDESSRFAFEQALEFAQRAGVTIYAIGLDLPKNDARRKLARFADETGGRSFFIDSAVELPGVYSEIEAELRSQYLIAYQSTNVSTDESFRFVEVEMGPPGLEAKTVRGYYPR